MGASLEWIRSCRFMLAMVGFLGNCVMYGSRVNVNVAIVTMVNQTAIRQHQPIDANITTNMTTEPKTTGWCEEKNSTDVISQKDGRFIWSKEVQGLLLGSFYWGYILTQVLAGWLAKKFGGKYVTLSSMALSGFLTLMSPLTANLHYRVLVLIRVLVGAAQGMVFSSLHTILGNWVPPAERSKLVSFTYAGTHIGTVLTMGTGGYICAYVGWEAIFYITGSLNLAWCLLWLFLVYETPATHPRVSTDERKYIEKSLVGMIKLGSQSSKVPWKDLFLSPAVWGATCGHFAALWSFYTFLTNMPSYVNEVLKLDISKNGLYTGMSYFLMWILMNGTGFFSDLLQNKRVLSRTYIRKIMFAFGSFIPAGMVIGVGFLDCEMNSVVLFMLILGVGSLGCALSVLVSIPMDIGPSYAGIIFGFSNTVATTSGILAPVVVGALTTGQSHEEWQIVFYICAGIAIFGFLMYCIMGSGEVQGWAKVEHANIDIIPEPNDGTEEKEKIDQEDDLKDYPQGVYRQLDCGKQKHTYL